MSEVRASLLDTIVDFCRGSKMAESTFGRRAVNDGKFVARLRDGARITPETLRRINEFITRQGGARGSDAPRELLALIRADERYREAPRAAADTSPLRSFRFFDNRQKYLLFVNTCSEKSVIARRVGLEFMRIHPKPPAIRVFDAGMGEGSVLTSMLRELHGRFPTMPLYVVAKEISLEDVRISLAKMADRLFEHPATVLAVTNMYYTEAPWLTPSSVAAATSLVWHEVALTGTTAHEFAEQLFGLESFLARYWQARHSAKTGNPVYERPVALVIYRDDYRFLLDDILPRQGTQRAEFDLVIASQPFRARAPLDFKITRVLVPLVRALRPGGRLLAIQSHGNDPGLEIVREIWPGEAPFVDSRHDLLRRLRADLGREASRYNFNSYADDRAIFRYEMHTLPTEIAASIGTSTLFAAWNAATYVAQIDDERLAGALRSTTYLDATREVLQRHGRLWFHDESFVVSRKRD